MAYSHGRDEIPLQNRPKDVEMNDHVYNAAGTLPERPGGPPRRKTGIRFGELGMLRSGGKRIPWVVYLFSTIQIGVFIGELVRNAQLTGSPIVTQLQFNPMIGPSPYVLINMGARFLPCMHNVQGVQTSPVPLNWPCPSTSDLSNLSQKCTLSELCGFNGVPEQYGVDIYNQPQPNQWFRFIIPMFMHTGLVHIGFNLLMQLTTGREMEMAIGPIRFFLVYVLSGIFGFVMGGNFGAPFISSTGASGALFGIMALTLLDLLYSWSERRNPVKDLIFIIAFVLVSFVLGLLPGLDNFSHIGGFLMGLAMGISVLHSPNALRRRIGEEYAHTTYASVGVGGESAGSGSPPAFLKNPVGFFKGRKPLWWAWWFVRIGALVTALIVFILLLNNFYVYHNTCSWCKYLTCLPVNGWCDIGNPQAASSSSPNRARELLETVPGLVAGLMQR